MSEAKTIQPTIEPRAMRTEHEIVLGRFRRHGASDKDGEAATAGARRTRLGDAQEKHGKTGRAGNSALKDGALERRRCLVVSGWISAGK